jgi:hypothetical protein
MAGRSQPAWRLLRPRSEPALPSASLGVRRGWDRLTEVRSVRPPPARARNLRIIVRTASATLHRPAAVVRYFARACRHTNRRSCSTAPPALIYSAGSIARSRASAEGLHRRDDSPSGCHLLSLAGKGRKGSRPEKRTPTGAEVTMRKLSWTVAVFYIIGGGTLGLIGALLPVWP